jgi:tight adherence protein B
MDLLAAMTASLAVMMLAASAARSLARRPADQRLKVLAAGGMQIERRSDGDAILRPGVSSMAFFGRFLDRRGYAERWRIQLDRAGLAIRPGEYWLIRCAFAAVCFVAPLLLLQDLAGFLIGLAVAAGAFMLPAMWVGARAQKRTHKIERQLTETITLISNAQRAGFAFAQGVETAAERMGPPISTELARMMLDINMGSSTEDALQAMNERIGSEDLDLVVTAILIQRQTGGNLTEVLDNVTDIMRDRDRIKGEINTMTASQRMSALVLSLWPAILGLVVFAVNPGMMSLMWTTLPGIIMLITWGCLNLAGFLTMRRILNIDF